ncbi:MAG: DegT/DnrJ/EryC1/StrS family aminotransferase, partial [Bacteroidota bacterium]
CIGTGNGTDAIWITLKNLGIGPGDEVITAANTFIATSESISMVGATPVFADVDPYFTLDPVDLEKKITKKTRAVIAVHLFGQMADMEKISQICKDHDLLLIEDAAQAHLSRYKNHFPGHWGEAATYSFYPAKNLGAYGDGGCIVTNSEELDRKIRIYCNHGSPEKHLHVTEGINSRLDALQAAVLSVKLKHLESWNKQRIVAAAKYRELLSGIPQIQLPLLRPDSEHTYHLYVIAAEQRNKLQAFLKSKDIDTGIHYPVALPFMPCYTHLGYKPTDVPNSFQLQDKILSLPIFPEIISDQVFFVADTIRGFYLNY